MNSINFFADQAQTSIDKFITWCLSWGRAIVMITELIALLAFLYRFGLDRQLSDFHDKIKQHQLIVTASKHNEDTFRNLQQRLVFAKQFNQNAQTITQEALQVIDQAKGNVQFTSFNLSLTDIHMLVTSNSTAGLNTFVSDLRNLPFVQGITIDSVQSKQDTQQYLASISILMNKSDK